MRLSKVLRQYMWAEKLTLRPLAKELGMSAATLNRFLNGGELSGEHLASLLRWLLDTQKGFNPHPALERGATVRPDWVAPPKPENIGDIYRVAGYPYDKATEYGVAYEEFTVGERAVWWLLLGDGDIFPWSDIEAGDIMADKVEMVRRNPLPEREHTP